MKSLTLHLACGFAFAFLCITSAVCQGCGGWMQPAYSYYTSMTASNNTIYTSVLVDGSTNGTCLIGCGCSGIRHTPQAYNQIGTVGGWQTGTAGPYNSYISEQNNQSFLATPGVIYTFGTAADVLCSAVGLFWNQPTTQQPVVEQPNCGALALSAPPQVAVCDGGKTTNHAPLSIGGNDVHNVQRVVANATSLPFELNIGLEGKPTPNNVCANKAGGNSWCFIQNYSAGDKSDWPSNAHITWTPDIYCRPNETEPDITSLPVSQLISCQ